MTRKVAFFLSACFHLKNTKNVQVFFSILIQLTQNYFNVILNQLHNIKNFEHVHSFNIHFINEVNGL